MSFSAVKTWPGTRPLVNRGAPLMSGKPPINQPAIGPAPTIDLGLPGGSAMARIRKAGPAGVAIGDDLPVSTAIRLALAGLATIDKATPQRVRARKFSA